MNEQIRSHRAYWAEIERQYRERTIEDAQFTGAILMTVAAASAVYHVDSQTISVTRRRHTDKAVGMYINFGGQDQVLLRFLWLDDRWGANFDRQRYEELLSSARVFAGYVILHTNEIAADRDPPEPTGAPVNIMDWEKWNAFIKAEKEEAGIRS